MGAVKHPLTNEGVKVTVTGVVKQVQGDIVEIITDGNSTVRVSTQDREGTHIEYHRGEFQPGSWYKDRMNRLWLYDEDIIGYVWHLGGDSHSRGNPSFPCTLVTIG